MAQACTYVLSTMSGLGYKSGQTSETGTRRLVCRACGHERLLTQAWIDELRAIVSEPGAEDDVLSRLLHRFRCSQCQARDLQVVQDERLPGAESCGSITPICAECGKAITLKRLQAMPGTPFCLGCQERFEKDLREDLVHCERCGARMVLRVRESILPTKYFLGCSNYPRCRFVIAGSW
jgi:DNA-directed RNA polymerase subunit RPC12/RpoP